MAKITYTKDQINLLVKSSTSISDVLRKLGKPKNGYYVTHIEKWIKHFDCDVSHFSHGPEKTFKLTCSDCGKQFDVCRADRNKRKFCSLECANQKIRGAAIPKAEEDLFGSKKFRIICFRYHKKECVVCGESNIVGVHHYDENHDNNEPKNLIPMCPTHHCYVHSNLKHLISEKVDEYYRNFKGL